MKIKNKYDENPKSQKNEKNRFFKIKKNTFFSILPYYSSNFLKKNMRFTDENKKQIR